MARLLLEVWIFIGFGFLSDVSTGDASNHLACADGQCKQLQAKAKANNGLQLLQRVRSHKKTLFDPEEEPTLCAVQGNHCFDWKYSVEGAEAQPVASVHPLPTEMGVQIVVTRAGEDVRWLDALHDFPAILYNRKGSDKLLPRERPNLQIIQADNTGREDDSMLRHIIQHYDSLAQVTIFVQGWPFGHCDSLVQTLRRMMEVTARNVEDSIENVFRKGIVPMSNTFYQYILSAAEVGHARELFENTGGDPDEKARSYFGDMCEEVLGEPCPDTLWVSYGAQWAVHKNRILKRTKEHYQRILDIGEGYQSKYRGLVLEALWPYLWSADTQWTPEHYVQMRAPGEEASPWSGLSHDRLHSYTSHCKGRMDGDDEASKTGRQAAGALCSCEDKMGFCEIERHEMKLELQDKVKDVMLLHETLSSRVSYQFLASRPRYSVSGESDPLDVDPWAMHIELRPMLYGMSTWVPPEKIAKQTGRSSSNDEDTEGLLGGNKQIVDLQRGDSSNDIPTNRSEAFVSKPIFVQRSEAAGVNMGSAGRLRLEPYSGSGDGLEWTMTDDPDGPPGQYLFKLAGSSELMLEPDMYLGCVGGEGQVVQHPYAWTITQFKNGDFHLVSQDGTLHYNYASDGNLRCEHDNSDIKDAVFSIHLGERGDVEDADSGTGGSP